MVSISILVLSCQILGIIYPYEGAIYGSPAMYSGLLFGISGSHGIMGGYNSSRCTTIANLVLSIISFCLSIALMAHSIVLSVLIHDGWYGIYWFGTGDEKSMEVSFGIFIALSIFGFAQAILSTAAIYITFKAVCCQKSVSIEDGEELEKVEEYPNLPHDVVAHEDGMFILQFHEKKNFNNNIDFFP